MKDTHIKKLSVKAKFILILLPVFAASVICIYMLNADYYIISVVLISYLIIAVAGYYILQLDITYALKQLNRQVLQIKADKKNLDLNNYETKINEFNSIYLELQGMKSHLVTNAEMAEAFESIMTMSERLLEELNTARVFKVNRNEFLGNVAHELRTPIFAVQLSLETLADGAVNDETVNMEFLVKALNQTNRLTELVDDLISISRLEAGMKLSKRYFRINNLIRETITELSHVAEKKGISLEFRKWIDDNRTVFGDAERIKQVLVNLVENSIKYTQRGGVYISTIDEEKSVAVLIEDTGIGIPKEDLPRIFERFYRVDKNRSRGMGGSGLGLSIVKHILELHNSAVKVESELNRGSRFEFRLSV